MYFLRGHYLPASLGCSTMAGNCFRKFFKCDWRIRGCLRCSRNSSAILQLLECFNFLIEGVLCFGHFGGWGVLGASWWDSGNCESPWFVWVFFLGLSMRFMAYNLAIKNSNINGPTGPVTDVALNHLLRQIDSRAETMTHAKTVGELWGRGLYGFGIRGFEGVVLGRSRRRGVEFSGECFSCFYWL